MTSLSDTSAKTAARKWDAEIITARQQSAWLAFEAGIHQNDTLIARVARALDRYGLGNSDITVGGVVLAQDRYQPQMASEG